MKFTPPQQLQSTFSESYSEGFKHHIPVLLEDTISYLAPVPGERYLDLTAGYGGHASKVADVIGAQNVTLVDRDAEAITALQPLGAAGAKLLHSDFLSAAETLVEDGQQFDMVLVDLGVSSPQLDRAERGFSIKRDGPLDMRMDQSTARTAADLVNKASKEELTRIIGTYGEERPAMAKRIALEIVKARPLHTTFELSGAVMSAHRGPYRSVHPATRTFQPDATLH